MLIYDDVENMSYLVLARKWRPQGFEDLIGQEPISRILSNALSQGKLAHAYLFSGPRGVGKTSTARILAKALNCEKGPTPLPCGVCTFCRGIAEGSSVDVMEIDGASNNSVNDIRDLRERVKYAPAGGRYKVYIIDEAHMLSDSAFNALLKTLEEPPSHVVFVLATTASRKIPATVLSRCQHLPFRRVPTQKIKERLRLISDAEAIRISDGAIDLVARAAEGSMRDSLTILDQVSAFSSDIEESGIQDLLGIADFKALADLSAATIRGERKRILEIINSLADTGADFKSFTKDLMNFFRDLLVAKVVEKPEEILDMSDAEFTAVRDILKIASEDHLTLLLSEMIKAEADVRLAFSPRVTLEMSLIRASFLSSLRPVKEAIETIESFLTGQSGPAHPGEEPTGRPVRKRQKEVTGERVTGPAEPEQTRGTETSSGKSLTADSPDAAPSVSTIEGDSITAPDMPPPGRGEDQGEVSGSSVEEEEALPQQQVREDDFPAALMERIEAVNHPLACKLSQADMRVEGEILSITFNGGIAIHADSIKKNQRPIEEIASAIAGKKIRIVIETVKKKVPRKKDLREKILSEPIVKEAINLFDGRIVDVTLREKPGEGGRDV